ncbi:hypothetical protein [Nocardioides sp.]|uniref:hypothetical protein n=1 Tax=Nocardioides sp. TaxID=35761 RepID=UPI0025D82259|nr:hypothetical protein [Nocardioides sp.]
MRPLGAAVAITLSGILVLSACGSDTASTASDDSTPRATPSTLTPSPSSPSAPSSEPPPSTTSSASAEPALLGQEAATALRSFAVGRELPPLTGQVDLYLGNAFTGFVTRKRAVDPTAWATCTEIGDYAGRACPLSPLDVLAQHRRVAYVGAPDSGCLKTYGPVPPDLRKLTHVAIVPAPGSVDSCIDDFAVQVFSDENGALMAVSLLLGEP